MNTLYLTASEKTMYEALPESLKEGWVVETESFSYSDSPEKCVIRLSLVRLHDPKLLEIRQRAQSMSSVDEVAELLKQSDLSHVDEDDLAELFFAVGPEIMSRIIAELLPNVSSDKDMEGVTSLTVIRHSILSALVSVS